MMMATNAKRRRQLIAGLGTTAAAIAIGTPATVAQTTSRPFEPSLYPQDDWLGTRPSKHRVVLDTVTANGVADAIRFANNLFNGSKTGYSVDEADMAIVVCLRHLATGYGYTDALWSKYGRVLERAEENGRTAGPTPPTTNSYDTGDGRQLSAMAKRGVQFMVCATASRALAGRAAGTNGNVDAVFKEFEANLISSARLVAAGVVGVAHAQERGYSYLYVG
jgi:intracellular sulfur oxidation DsrE/DsrF family protein